MRAFFAILLAATPVGVLTATVGPSAASASASWPELPTITVSDSTVRLGRTVTVSGKGPLLRRIVLQMRTLENGWQEIASLHTGLDGAYRFRAPDWHGVHRLRVVAPATLVFVEAVSEVRTVTVRMPYRPPGRRSDWSWMSHRGARWDPCRTITYRINPRGGYARSTSDIRRTFREVGRLSGFRFRYLGTTTRTVRRNEYDAHPAGTDVLVDWQTPRRERVLSGGVAGVGGHWVLHGRRHNGFVLLDQAERLSRGTWRQVMAHEVGHVLGVGHARTRRQLMYGTATSLNRRWGAGDLWGLWRVGASQGCLKTQTQRAAPGVEPYLVSDT